MGTSEIVMEAVSEYITENIKKAGAEEEKVTHTSGAINTQPSSEYSATTAAIKDIKTDSSEEEFVSHHKENTKVSGLKFVEQSDKQNQIIIYYNRKEAKQPLKEKEKRIHSSNLNNRFPEMPQARSFNISHTMHQKAG